MGILFSLIIIFICVIVIFFNLPFSKTKSEFIDLSQGITNNPNTFDGVFTEADIEKLPVPVKNYFDYCGFIGKTKMSYMNAIYTDVPFL